MNTCASIAVFAFKRLGLLQQTLSALERCEEFRASPVHVFSDAAREDQPGEADAVNRLRVWLRTWCTQHKASLDEAPANRGLRPSIVSGVTALVREYGRVIVLEDDIIVSPAFLTFMNQALEACRDRLDICQISGYNIPHREPLPTAGLLRVPACWGWATWRRAWDCYSDDAVWLLEEIRRRDVKAFNINGSYDYFAALERNAAGLQNTWAVRWYASVFRRGGLTVYPGQSLTRNIGFDDDGTNCGPCSTARAFLRQRLEKGPVKVNWQTIGRTENQEFAAALEKFYRWQQHQWTKPTLRQRFQARWRRLFVVKAIV